MNTFDERSAKYGMRLADVENLLDRLVDYIIARDTTTEQFLLKGKADDEFKLFIKEAELIKAMRR